MKVYLLSSAKVVKRFETARKSVRNLCARQQTPSVTAKKSTAPRNRSSILGYTTYFFMCKILHIYFSEKTHFFPKHKNRRELCAFIADFYTFIPKFAELERIKKPPDPRGQSGRLT